MVVHLSLNVVDRLLKKEKRQIYVQVKAQTTNVTIKSQQLIHGTVVALSGGAYNNSPKESKMVDVFKVFWSLSVVFLRHNLSLLNT